MARKNRPKRKNRTKVDTYCEIDSLKKSSATSKELIVEQLTTAINQKSANEISEFEAKKELCLKYQRRFYGFDLSIIGISNSSLPPFSCRKRPLKQTRKRLNILRKKPKTGLCKKICCCLMAKSVLIF
ncbi:hypothetical protein MHBO_003125 [Bonamia ostreae]|uniref:Uncharacterized protein n=1 Tax=Bonamia ostreae TaxID=126728 RepID=A0ABV2APX4_9EUKA